MLSPPFNINKHFAILPPICDERLAVLVKSNLSPPSPLMMALRARTAGPSVMGGSGRPSPVKIHVNLRTTTFF